MSWRSTPARTIVASPWVAAMTCPTRECLDRRIPSTRALTEQAAPWEAARNQEAIGVNWRFTAADARIKLHHLYPAH